MESEKYLIFAKVLHNIQTTYINQQSRSKVEIGTMIGGMKEDIRKMIGNKIPEGSIDSMINQLQGMSGILEQNFSELFTMINEIKDGINKILEEQQTKNTWLTEQLAAKN